MYLCLWTSHWKGNLNPHPNKTVDRKNEEGNKSIGNENGRKKIEMGKEKKSGRKYAALPHQQSWLCHCSFASIWTGWKTCIGHNMVLCSVQCCYFLYNSRGLHGQIRNQRTLDSFFVSSSGYPPILTDLFIKSCKRGKIWGGGSLFRW